MAPIRRAKSYLVYLIALLISAVFSLFGRHAPVWAQEVSADRNAKVFRDTMQSKKPYIIPREEHITLQGGSMPAQQLNTVGAMPLSPEAQSAFASKSAVMLKEIEDTVKTGGQLTSDQTIFLKQVENEALIDAMNQRINDLSVQMDTMLKLLKEGK